jgi:hypothetical protein
VLSKVEGWKVEGYKVEDCRFMAYLKAYPNNNRLCEGNGEYCIDTFES